MTRLNDGYRHPSPVSSADYGYRVTANTTRQMPRGWWLLPAMVVSAGMWGAILMLVL